MPERKVDVGQNSVYCKASWSLGNDPPTAESTYSWDYNIGNTEAWHHTLAAMPPRYPKSMKRSPNLLDTDLAGFSTQPNKEGKHKGKTAISFGNDNEPKVTAYQEFAKELDLTSRRPPCNPLQSTDVISMPCVSRGPHHQRSCVRDDFGYLGPRLWRSVYTGRCDSLAEVRTTLARDSVAASLLQGRRHRKLLTRSMVDYQSPMDRVKGNIKNLMVTHISPSVRADSIWFSVNNGGRQNLCTESTVNYGWPHASKGMRHFYRSPHPVPHPAR